MKALVVYESMFGNTATIARAVADGLTPAYDVTLADVRDMPAAVDADLLVVGGPTHAFGLSRPSTRIDATKQGDVRPGAAATGIREYLDGSGPLGGTPVAAFDTTVKIWFFTGSAARKALQRLRRLGGRPVVPAESFRVTGTAGPLLDGESARAAAWGRAVAQAAAR